MNCRQVSEHLSDYIDGALTRRLQQEVAEHLRSCVLCHQEMKALREIVVQAGKLASDIPPVRDLWPAIESRLDAVRTARAKTIGPPQWERQWWLQPAAAVVTLLVLSVPLSVWWASRRGGEPPSTTEATYSEVSESLVVKAETARSEDGVLLAKEDLLKAIESRRNVLESPTLQVVEDTMTVLDQAIGEIRAALEDDPHNRRLRMLLSTRYQQERRLLQKVSRV